MYILFTIQTYKANNFKTYILLQDSEISYITVRETKCKLLIRKCLVPKINVIQMSSVTIRLACEFTLCSFFGDTRSRSVKLDFT